MRACRGFFMTVIRAKSNHSRQARMTNLMRCELIGYATSPTFGFEAARN